MSAIGVDLSSKTVFFRSPFQLVSSRGKLLTRYKIQERLDEYQGSRTPRRIFHSCPSPRGVASLFMDQDGQVTSPKRTGMESSAVVTTQSVHAREETCFSFEKFLQAFERIRYDEPPVDEPWPLPYLVDFVQALSSVADMFQHLGAAFSFVRQDVVEKRDTLWAIYRNDPKHNTTLRQVIERETREGRLNTGSGKEGGARNILRMMWCLRFIQVLMRELGNCPAGCYAKRSATRECIWTAYQEALREHHGTVVIAAVRAALFFLPPIEQFMRSIGVEVARKDEYLRRVQQCFDPLVNRMYSYYAHRDLLGLQ
jgi:hypothetical protein